MTKSLTAFLLATAVYLCSCNANIVGQDNSKLLSALTPTYTGGIPNPWYLYDDALRTGDWLRGLDFFSGGTFTGTPVIEFGNTTTADVGTKSWRFSIATQTGAWYCGIILLQGSGFADSTARPGVDISGGAFTKCVFRARTAQGLRQIQFKAFDNGANSITVNVNSGWQTFSIPLSNASAIINMKQFFTVVFANAAPATTTPIDLFIDELRFEK